MPAPSHLSQMEGATLGCYLDDHAYGAAFREDHLYPMTAAIWSIPPRRVADYPAQAFTRFCENHGLLKIAGRPVRRTVVGGSREHVKKLIAPVADRLLLNAGVRRVTREADGVNVNGPAGRDVSIMSSSRRMPIRRSPCSPIRATTRNGSFPASPMAATKPFCMATPRDAEASVGVVELELILHPTPAPLSVTYWMNRLQGVPEETPLFVTLNPAVPPVKNSFTGALFTNIRSSRCGR